MPIKAERTWRCHGCGKKLAVQCHDDMTVKELVRLHRQLCFKCKIIKIIRGL